MLLSLIASFSWLVLREKKSIKLHQKRMPLHYVWGWQRKRDLWPKRKSGSKSLTNVRLSMYPSLLCQEACYLWTWTSTLFNNTSFSSLFFQIEQSLECKEEYTDTLCPGVLKRLCLHCLLKSPGDFAAFFLRRQSRIKGCWWQKKICLCLNLLVPWGQVLGLTGTRVP